MNQSQYINYKMKKSFLRLFVGLTKVIKVSILKIISWGNCRHLELEDMDRVLIIAPHPDDEVFGCGNLIYELSSRRKSVSIIILSKGEQGCNLPPDLLKHERQKLAIKANEVLGCTDITFLDFPDGHFGDVTLFSVEVRKLESLLDKKKPDNVFIPHEFDFSSDHLACTRLLTELFEKSNFNVYYYCVWFWYHMPLSYVFKLNYMKMKTLVSRRIYKDEAYKIYVNSHTPDGAFYSGVSPRAFLKAVHSKRELFFVK